MNKFFAIPILLSAVLAMLTSCSSDSVDGNPDYFRKGAFVEENDGKSIDLREVEKDLRQIKGIGDKRIEEIMAVIEKHLGV